MPGRVLGLLVAAGPASFARFQTKEKEAGHLEGSFDTREDVCARSHCLRP